MPRRRRDAERAGRMQRPALSASLRPRGTQFTLFPFAVFVVPRSFYFASIIRVRMRFKVLLPVLLLLPACTKRSDETRPGSPSDSSEVVTELSPTGESTSVARQGASSANAGSKLT